jgi:hypothetical protein
MGSEDHVKVNQESEVEVWYMRCVCVCRLSGEDPSSVVMVMVNSTNSHR